MSAFVGKWKLVESENFDEFMKVLGVGMVMRKLGNTLKPNQEIEMHGDGTMSIKTISSFKTTEIKFKFGEPFQEHTLDGDDVQSVVTMDDEKKLTHIQQGKIKRTIIREVHGDDYTMTMEANGVTAKRKYHREQ